MQKLTNNQNFNQQQTATNLNNCKNNTFVSFYFLLSLN